MKIPSEANTVFFTEEGDKKKNPKTSKQNVNNTEGENFKETLGKLLRKHCVRLSARCCYQGD